MERLPVTRRDLGRDLVLNAARRPLNIAVPAAVLVAGVALGTLWLLPLALLIYVAMCTITFLDADVAESVGRKTYAKAKTGIDPVDRHAIDPPPLSAAVSEKLGLARAEEGRIRTAIEQSPLPLPDLGDEIERLMSALTALGRRADVLHTYLDADDADSIGRRLDQLRAATDADAQVTATNAQTIAALEDQLAVRAGLTRQLSHFNAQMDHIAAVLGAIHAQIVRMSVEDEAQAQDRVTTKVRELRLEVSATAEAMAHAYSDIEDRR